MTVAANQVAFYGAAGSDYASAVSAAEANGVPMANVTGDFNTAATWVDNGTYLVIAVGHPANLALFWNPCGWHTTAYSLSSYPACQTPFDYYSYPYDGAIVAGLYESADGVTARDSLQLAMMLGHYAIYGAYPQYLSTLPTVRTLSGQTCSTSDCTGSSSNTCPTISCNSTLTFGNVCGSESAFLSNADVICWAQQASQKAQVPVDLLLAQWVYEGANVCTAIAVSCNNPGNANSGTFSRCAPAYTAPACSTDSGFAGASTGLSGALMNADIYNAGYCEVASADQSATLTAGGQELKTYAENAGWPLLSNNTYNALYQLGDYSPVWASSQYTTNYIGGSPSSSVPGSGLVYMIGVHNLSQYDYVYSLRICAKGFVRFR